MTRPLARSLVSASLLLLAACSPHQPSTPPPAAPPVPSRPRAPEKAPPPARDVSEQVLGWAVLSDGTALVRAAARMAGRPGSPLDELAAKAALARIAGIEPHLALALALDRPAAIAVLHPSVAPNARPLVAMLPVLGAAEVDRALAAANIPVQRLPWGFSTTIGGATVYVAIRDRTALVAPRPELIDAAARVLDGPVHARAEAPLVVHVAADHLFAAWGPEIDGILAHFIASIDEREDPQLTFALRGARRIARFADSMRSLDLLVGSDDAGLSLTVRADGQPGGEWAELVSDRSPSAAAASAGASEASASRPWGGRLVPRDAVLAWMTRRSERATTDELGAAVDYLAETSDPAPDEGARAEWRGALGRAAEEMAGDIVWAIVPGGEGGVGVVGAYRVRDGAAARRQAIAAWRALAPHMSGAIARALRLDPARYPMVVAVRSFAATGGAPARDEIAVSVRWPRGSATARRSFERLFGRELVLSASVVGDAVVFAVGRDGPARLRGLCEAARGKPSASLLDDGRFRAALADGAAHRVSMSYMPLAEMARFLGAVLASSHGIAPSRLAELAPLLAATGGGAIVSSTHAEGERYTVSTRLPASALPGLPGAGLALWKLALSPLLNPPAMPPLPIPPPQATPRLEPPARPRRLPDVSRRDGLRTL